MDIAYNHKFFSFVNAAREKEDKPESRLFKLAERLLRFKILVFLVFAFENVVGFILALPVPLYSTLVYMFITHLPGLPGFCGMYIRAIYYRRRLGSMESNVLIDQCVYFAQPKGVHLAEFSFIDKYVTIMSDTCIVGRRVHIAPRVIITGGGDFQIEDYACIATGSNIITSSEILEDGARCSGPMVDPMQRNVLRGKVLIKKDAFIGANATILPKLTVAQGSVAGANVVLTKSTEPWGIYVGAKTQKLAYRDEVIWEDN